MTADNSIQIIGIIVVAVLGIAGLIGTFAAMRAWSNSAENKARIERLEADTQTFALANEELRKQIDDKNNQIAERDTRHREEVAELRGQVKALTGELVRGLVDQFRSALTDALNEVLGRSEVTHDDPPSHE